MWHLTSWRIYFTECAYVASDFPEKKNFAGRVDVGYDLAEVANVASDFAEDLFHRGC